MNDAAPPKRGIFLPVHCRLWPFLRSGSDCERDPFQGTGISFHRDAFTIDAPPVLGYEPVTACFDALPSRMHP
jgi:hypothetical protein